MTSDFRPLSLDTLQKNSTYAASKGSTPTLDELEDLGFTVADSDDAYGLNFEDFLQLMVQQLQNQTIDNTADTSDMLNQMVQMSTVQIMTQVQSSLEEITAANTLTYAASLVNKTVTVGSYDEEGNLQEVVGEVTATGTYQGTPVIFVDGEMYPLSSIMAVGVLPEKPPEEGEGDNTGDGTGDGNTDGTNQVPGDPKG